MSIKSFIQKELIMFRLQKEQVLAVYDPDDRH